VRLSNQHYAEILSRLRGQELSPSDRELRRSTRMQLRAKVAIRPYTGTVLGPAVMTLARDISMEGIGLLTNIHLQSGDALVVALPRNATHIVYVKSVVAFCDRVADGLYALGCRFEAVVDKP
jgi:hypothetical protein